MEVAHANPRLFEVRRELFGHALRERGDDHALLLLHTALNSLKKIVNLPLRWKHGDVRVYHACWADELLHYLVCALSFVAARCCRNIDRLAHARFKLFKGQRAIVERTRQAEAEVNEDLFSRAVVLVHPHDLRNAHVTLIDHKEPIGWEIVEQRPWPGARLAAREVAGIVLDPGAEANLAHHLQVKGGALAQTSRFKDLPRRL